jgi:acetyltransferase-like isoleucine patch superfamily enzyme
MSLSPIALFVYNRPDHTRRTLEALAENELADQSTLYVFSDGPKNAILEEDTAKVTEVRRVLRERQWCKEVIVVEADHNKGLANSIVSGVTKIVNQHGRVIVLEDDIVTQMGFLRYMNAALEMYVDDEQVMQISGMIYGTPESVSPEGTSFLRVLACHGWATWKRAWDHYTHNLDVLLDRLQQQGISRYQFDIEGTTSFYQQIIENQRGRLNTWAVRWYASWLTANGYALFPHRSLVTNIGHDGTGTHIAASFYNGETIDHIDVTRIPIAENTQLRQEVSNIWREGLQGLGKKKRRPSFLARLRNTFSPIVRNYSVRLLLRLYPPLKALDSHSPEYGVLAHSLKKSEIASTAKLYAPYIIWETAIGDYTYVGPNTQISLTRIGKFCSIGPNFLCGWGIHPLDGISTAPMFYSTAKQNGTALSSRDKIEERKPIVIGNDVFIGMNVIVLDGVTIGNGAVIGAGTIVSKDVPPYAIVVGNPMKILRYRFDEDVIQQLQKIHWWDWSREQLDQVEHYFFDVQGFVTKYGDHS